MKKFLLLFFVAIFLNSCEREDPPVYIPSSDATLKSFSFSHKYNDQMITPSSGVFFIEGKERIIYISVSEGVSLKNLVATFEIDEKAKVYTSEGTEVIPSETALDYSNLVKFKVKAEDGTEYSYSILVKNGKLSADNYVYNFMKNYSIPGISVSVLKNEELIYSSGYGFANKESEVRTTSKHLYRLASVSKQFTTICIMRLFEEKKLDLDKNIFGKGGILEEEFGDDISGNKATVSCRHFLQHTSGWISNPDPMFTSPYRNWDIDTMIEWMLSQDMSYVPGATHSYYNLGFGVLGRVVEKITGKAFEVYLKETLALADISDIHQGKDRSGRRSNECVYYSQSGTNGYANNMEAIVAAGGIIASTDEMMKLQAAIDGKPGIPDIITAETKTEMLTPATPATTRYALGWRIGHSLYPGGYYHSGNIAGTATIWCGGVNGDLSIAVLCNSRSYKTGFDDALYILLGNLVKLF